MAMVPEPMGIVSISALLTILANVAKILADGPKAVETASRIQRWISKFKGTPKDKVDLKSPRGRVMQKSMERLNKALDTFHSLDDREDYSQFDKDEARKALRKRTCLVLLECEIPLTDELGSQEYRWLRDFFCKEPSRTTV